MTTNLSFQTYITDLQQLPQRIQQQTGGLVQLRSLYAALAETPTLATDFPALAKTLETALQRTDTDWETTATAWQTALPDLIALQDILPKIRPIAKKSSKVGQQLERLHTCTQLDTAFFQQLSKDWNNLLKKRTMENETYEALEAYYILNEDLLMQFETIQKQFDRWLNRDTFTVQMAKMLLGNDKNNLLVALTEIKSILTQIERENLQHHAATALNYHINYIKKQMGFAEATVALNNLRQITAQFQQELEAEHKAKAAAEQQRIAAQPKAEAERKAKEEAERKAKETAEQKKRILKNLQDNMVLVKGGTFFMENRPTTLTDYYINKYLVTQAEWVAVTGNNPSNFKGDDRPVECVSWHDAQEFISKLNQLTGRAFRLPTEAQWEYAARGGNQSRGFEYAGSNNLHEVGWFSENSGRQTQPVGRKKANELGLYDMSGNLWEWCSDWYGGFDNKAVTNPTGASSGSSRVLRGGSWLYDAGSCRSAYRSGGTPADRYYFYGFRLAL